MNDQASPGLSTFEERLRAGRFVMTAEIAPPVSTDAQELRSKAAPLKGLADAVNVTDGAGARAHMAALAAASILIGMEIEPILQITCRDKNRIALQSEMMGAAALGIRNLLLLTGDDPKAGDQPDTKPVFDINSSTLIETARRLRDEGTLPTGRKVSGHADVLHRRRRHADRSAGRLAAECAPRQDQIRRAIRPDPVLHGCRDRAPLCRRAGSRPASPNSLPSSSASIRCARRNRRNG